MDLGLGNTLLAGDPRLVDHIVGEVKSQGIFDQFRKECIADVDTKPAYQNLRTRVESSVNSFLGKQVWRADLNKNQLRETLRKHIHDAPYLDAGVERIVDQVVNPKVYSVFMPQIEEVVYKFLGLERPRARERNGGGLKDLLPKDLDPVSPESDKNSLKDVSLDSVDAEMGIGGDAGNLGEESDSKNAISGNGVSESSEKSCGEVSKVLAGPASSSGALDTSGKSEDKPEEEEEESPVFEPIDIMNLNESNISNDSHLSGISELTSHRSRSPDFSNETSRDNMDFSNQDSQFSKVSSDSRLSIVTDFGSSNHASGPETPKDERDKNEVKFAKDNFRAVRDFDGSKVKEGRLSYEASAGREDAKSGKRSSSSKETSQDGTETSKEAGDSKEKSRDDVSRSKNSKEVRKANKESRKKSSSDGKGDKLKKTKEKSESSRDIASKESSTKAKDERVKEAEKKENTQGKEVKDLKDIYKEKIRELREKKELTEKEKLSKDTKSIKETKEKRDSSREVKKDTKDSKDSKESKSSSLKSHSSRSESKASRSEGKSSRSESRSSKRDDRKSLKDPRSKSQGGSDSNEKVDGRRSSKSEKEEKSEKSELRQDSKSKSLGKSSKNDSNKNSDGKRDSKSELEARDKKRRDDKKSKVKDDHSSARKSSDDRRSTDRDGSNGSNGKTSQKNNSTPSATTNKSVTSGLSKESTTTSNSSSETSDSIEERQNEKSAINIETKTSKLSKANNDPSIQRLDVGSSEITLPIKKRPLNNEDPSSSPASSDALIKKPKFAKNFQEAKRLMKIRRRMEREKLKKQVEPEVEIKPQQPPQIPAPTKKVIEEDLKLVPDEERVQIIEVCDEEYDEPYPEVRSDFTLEERSQIILGGESIFTSDFIAKQFNAKSTLSEMELSIRQSLKEMICDNLDEVKDAPKNSLETETGSKIQETVIVSSNPVDIETTIFGNSSLCSEIAENVKTSNKNQAKEITEENSRKNENSTDESEKNQSPEVTEKIDNPETNEDLKVPGEALTVEEQLEETCEFKNIVREMEKMEGNCKKIIVENSKMDETLETTENSETAQETNENLKNLEANAPTNPTFEIKNKFDDEQIEREESSKSNENSRTEMPSKENEEKEEKVTASSDAEPRRVSGSSEAEPKNSEKDSKPEGKVNADDEEMAQQQTDPQANPPETKEAEEEEPETKEIEQPEVRDDKKWLEDETSSTCNKQREEESTRSVKEKETSNMSDDEGPCLYFVEDTEKLEKFRKFLKNLEHEETLSEEYISETSNTEISCSMSKTMAPPKPKRKYSTSPLSDILLNNANNNNDAHKSIELISDHEETDNNMKKRKIGRPKKQKINANLCTQQNLSNGENFVMPLSPESDVSATSEKTPSNPLKDEKSRPRGSNQRYTSDDLYKPRPLFSSSSRRSRRSNQA